jgi:large subunit ribosomal protein L11
MPCGNGKPGPSVGQALGPLGVNMADFCRQFNERSEPLFEKDVPLTVQLKAMSDRSFTFDIRSPPTSYLIKRVVKMDKGPSRNSPEKPVAFISPEAVYEIAKIKQQDEMRWHLPLEGIARSVVGTARSMGVHVREVDEV